MLFSISLGRKLLRFRVRMLRREKKKKNLGRVKS